MHEKIVTIIKNSPAGVLVRRGDGIYNIYPKHIPDNSLTEDFSKGIIYDLINGQVDHTLTLYTVQLKVVARSYIEHREILLELKKAFNNKTYSDEGVTSGISSIVTNMVELGLDTDTGMYLSAIDINIKTALDI